MSSTFSYVKGLSCVAEEPVPVRKFKHRGHREHRDRTEGEVTLSLQHFWVYEFSSETQADVGGSKT